MKNGVSSDVYEGEIQEKNHGERSKNEEKEKIRKEEKEKDERFSRSGGGGGRDLSHFEGDFLKF